MWRGPARPNPPHKTSMDNNGREGEHTRSMSVPLGLSPTAFELWALSPAALVIPDVADGLNYYQVLGIDVSATKDELRKAYRKHVLRWHPNKVPAERTEVATERFKVISAAYEVLTDDAQRKKYDAELAEARDSGTKMPGSAVSLRGRSWKASKRKM